jgi:hypothetical protein
VIQRENGAAMWIICGQCHFARGKRWNYQQKNLGKRK